MWSTRGLAVATDVCMSPDHSTLSSNCYGVCRSSLCVVYALSTAEDRNKESSEAGFFYQGCAASNMPSCKTNVTSGDCQVQCLVELPASWSQPHWTLTVAKPQSDKTDTALFQEIDILELPSTLQELSIVGATSSSQISVPLSFLPGAFRSGTALQQLAISDVNVGGLMTNIFPDSLHTLIIQRAHLNQFDPRGSHAFTSVSILNLCDNDLSEIPTIIYEMRNLSALYLQGNMIVNAHVTLPQLLYLQKLPVFEANLTISGSCSAGYDTISWNGKSVCYTNGDSLGSIDGSESTEKSTAFPASGSDDSSDVVGVILGLVVFIVVAILGGVLLLRRWKQKAAKGQHDSLVAVDTKLKSSLRGLRARMGVNGTAQTSDLEASLNEYDIKGGGLRKAAFEEIPAGEVVTLNELSAPGPVLVALAEYQTKLVLVTKLRVSDDDIEAALDMMPVLSRMRHPQLLSICGVVWDERQAMTAVCEYMTLGTLEAYLRSSGSRLNWMNFKMKAAAEIARGLMYLHNQHMVTYDGLNGKSVFVDPSKGCKLNPMQAALATNESSRYSCQSYLRRCDTASKAYFAPEILVGGPSRSSSDMYAFGVLLAHLDTCQTADEMIRSSWKMRTHIGNFDTDNGTLLSADGTVISTDTSDVDNVRRCTTHLESLPSYSSYRSLQSSRSLTLEEKRRRTTPVLGTNDNNNTSFMSMFTFTSECPTAVRELAGACLQYDPSLRPSASYITAMLHI
ncbi:tkl protein kinase [Plasmopara halstedii]|uniref:Tkl protein kinase n=1 Tax=Plasmopara halstedii TaxID=4781 RepID=A0A0P1ABU2_PLAHL|nr:tkl protein kinase [Plasmopara halstedii]CEG37878.1 tkl protein kinase [Plasmopara halstedii]|eukprot:XP_024574247.1 tkl protein kinase [Plasmopara halstedii]